MFRGRCNNRNVRVVRLRLFVKFIAATFTRHCKQKPAFAPATHNSSIPAHYPSKAAITVPLSCLIGIEEALRIDESRHCSIRIFSIVFPGKCSARRHHVLGMSFIGPKVKKVATMAHPLVENPRGEILVKAKL